MNRLNSDTEIKVSASIRFLNETIQFNANEPSLAYYRIQEHVQKNLPSMVQRKYELQNLQEQMSGLVFDIEYSVDAVKDLAKSTEHVNNILTHLEKALSIGSQISLFRQQHIEQQLFEKKDGPLLSSLKK
ncbi:unnamed protein product [Rotaria socialis]|uniref:Uncharacterized protein n=1 Tax=Rotaria socialis TaxID=392032 RepID=A0A818AI42_9BILA|nr:unnamed protein product [Rotaria socialis]CAF3436722.1 unnamed protein product [Rotaria socialis]CAF3449514.1 unnamed protein product [Rotaria socialis]CAF3776910.1 unnamed protein product [Rotaria socialis]CAF4109916.1 unnamed protein product [Rotaria socialis]